MMMMISQLVFQRFSKIFKSKNVQMKFLGMKTLRSLTEKNLNGKIDWEK